MHALFSRKKKKSKEEDAKPAIIEKMVDENRIPTSPEDCDGIMPPFSHHSAYTHFARVTNYWPVRCAKCKSKPVIIYISQHSAEQRFDHFCSCGTILHNPPATPSTSPDSSTESAKSMPVQRPNSRPRPAKTAEISHDSGYSRASGTSGRYSSASTERSSANSRRSSNGRPLKKTLGEQLISSSINFDTHMSRPMTRMELDRDLASRRPRVELRAHEDPRWGGAPPRLCTTSAPHSPPPAAPDPPSSDDAKPRQPFAISLAPNTIHS